MINIDSSDYQVLQEISVLKYPSLISAFSQTDNSLFPY